MKRNWKIIRAVLCEENTDQWDKSIVNEHRWLCWDAGYIKAEVVRSVRELMVISNGLPWQTQAGIEAAELMKSEGNLDDVLRELDDKGVGHVSDFVFALLRRNAESLHNVKGEARRGGAELHQTDSSASPAPACSPS